MRPLTILTGFILGSAVSITFSVAVVALIFAVLAPDYPQVRAEVRPLLTAAVLFSCLTATAGLSFIGMLRRRRWRWVAQGIMWAGVTGIVFYFLP